MGVNKTIDITSAERQTILALLARFLPGVETWAHGSRVKWTSRPDSDLDLVVLARPEQRAQVSELKEAFDQSSLSFRVDLAVWDEIPEHFRRNIEIEHVVLGASTGKLKAGQNLERNKDLFIPSAFGTLPNGWTWSRLDEICEGVFDCPHSTPKLTKTGPLVVRTQDIITGVFRAEAAGHVSEETYKERVARVIPRRGDLLYSREGTYFGIAAEVPEHTRLCLGQRMVLIRPKASLLDFRYLVYWLNSPIMTAYIHGFRDGLVAERLNLPTIRALPILVPPLSEQKAIAGVLGSLDDKIESNRRTSHALERMARAIFRAWFVDFEPVKAKAAGAHSFPGMPQEAFDALPYRFVESELGLVPEGWRVLPLSEVVEINPPRKLAKGVLAPYLDMGQMPTDGHAPAAWAERKVGSGARFMNGDTLVARITPCLENGKTAFVDFLEEGQVAWGSTEYIVLRPKPPIPYLYAYLLARTPEFRAFAIQKMTGSSGRQRVPFDTMSKFDVAVGPAPLMEVFGAAVDPLFKRSSAGACESRKLAALRDYLLPKLLSGEVRAADSAHSVLEPAAASRERRPGHE